MADFLVIRLHGDAAGTVSWIAADSNGTRLSQPAQGSLDLAALDAGDRPVIVLVPAADVLTTTVNLPVRGASRLLATLPFALEDQLADDVENLHFAAGPKRDDGRVPVAVVSRERMDAWLAELEDVGIKPAQIVPETFGLARIPGIASMLITEEQIIFNDGENLEFAMQDVKPSDALVAAGSLKETSAGLEDAEAGASHLLVYCEPRDEQRFEHDWIALRHELDSVDINLLPDGALPRLAVTVASGNGVNLLQGEYGSRTDYAKAFRPWRNVAALFAGLLVIAVALKGVDYARLSSEAATLKEQFTEQYRQIRPGDDREVMDPVGTVNSLRRGLVSGGGPTVFLPALRELGAALQQHETLAIEAISYRAGILNIRLTAPDVATLDTVQRAVSGGGRFSASIQSTDQVGDRI
nr:type II secretion system protein GspL [Woeseiaceae bacterium]